MLVRDAFTATAVFDGRYLNSRKMLALSSRIAKFALLTVRPDVVAANAPSIEMTLPASTRAPMATNRYASLLDKPPPGEVVNYGIRGAHCHTALLVIQWRSCT